MSLFIILIFMAIMMLGFFMIKLEDCLEKRIEETNYYLEELLKNQEKIFEALKTSDSCKKNETGELNR